MDKRSINKGTSGASVGFGMLALLAPRQLAALYQSPSTPESLYMTREWGTKMVGLGALTWRLPDDDLDTAFLIGGVVSAVDAVGGVLSSRLNGTENIGPMLSGATSALFAGLCFYARTL